MTNSVNAIPVACLNYGKDTSGSCEPRKHLVESDRLMDVSVDEVVRISDAVALFVAQIQKYLVGQLAEL